VKLRWVFGARLQSHASFPLTDDQLGEAPEFLVGERLEVDRVEWGTVSGFLGHRTSCGSGSAGSQDSRP